MRENKENKLSIKKIVDKKEKWMYRARDVGMTAGFGKITLQHQNANLKKHLTTISSFDRQYIASST